MKKKNVINLIRFYAEHNDSGFRNEAHEIAREFEQNGDSQLAEYIMALMSNANTFIPQMGEDDNAMFERIRTDSEPLYLPESIAQDLLGILHAVNHHAGVNKFLLQGKPGTGKTEAVKQLARTMNREIFMVDFAAVIDSKMGQTTKNISRLYKEMNSFIHPEQVIVLFDEIDAVALDRTNSNDLREMGRATSAMLKGMDHIDERIVLIATTNLYEHFDKALTRRFDAVIDFNRYDRDDLIMVAEKLLESYLIKFKLANKDIRLFRKIMKQMVNIPYPGDLKNMIKSAVAFSDPQDGLAYFRRLYYAVFEEMPQDIVLLKKQGFTVREIGVLTKKSKSSIDRELKGVADE
ncbi:MAG: ATP-binding protein [Bacteroides sp.]|nr:ATP-binding protein [Bacteroides sp.]MCM1549170.1 ATP-binding protein [Clostridium sp.]